jgi:hypothetical protein
MAFTNLVSVICLDRLPALAAYLVKTRSGCDYSGEQPSRPGGEAGDNENSDRHDLWLLSGRGGTRGKSCAGT